MITADTTKFGYSYTHDLCRAIELFTAAAVHRSCDVFLYRGLNLRYAVERQLYVRCVNSDALFGLYVDQLTSERSSARWTLDAIEAEVARHLFPAQSIEHFNAHLEVRQFPGCYQLRWLYRRLRDLPYGWRRLQPRQSTPVLFHVVHPKFAEYLKPVTDKLSGQFAYLVTVDKGLSGLFERMGLPHVDPQCGSSSVHAAFVKGPLRHFANLIDAVDNVYSAISSMKPKCVVVVEGNAALDVVTSEVCKQFSIPVLCIQQGWSPYVHSGFRNMSFANMLVWGRGFVKLLAKYNPQQHFTVVGNHAIQELAIQTVQGAHIGMAISFFLQAPCALLSKAGYEQFVDLIVSCAASHPNVRMLVREHPSYPLPVGLKTRLSGHVNVHFSSPTNDSLAELIQASDLVVSVFSTVLLEAIALGTVPLVCNIGSLPQYEPDIAGTGAGIEVKTVEAAKQIIDRAIHEPDFLERYRQKLKLVADEFFSTQDAADLIARKIREEAGMVAAISNANSKQL